ncbi:hypothetical protein ACFE04_020856 [Oxalis oulophora]
MDYWVRWDASPNHQVIHDIILKFDDWVAENSKKKAMAKKEKRKIKYSTITIDSKLGEDKLARPWRVIQVVVLEKRRDRFGADEKWIDLYHLASETLDFVRFGLEIGRKFMRT